jgi:hypothetical protein
MFIKFNNSLWKNNCKLIGVNHIHLKNVQIPIIIYSMNKAIFNSNNGCKWWWNFKNIRNKDFQSYYLIMATSCSWPIKEKINLKLLNSKLNMKVNKLWNFFSSYLFKKEKEKSILNFWIQNLTWRLINYEFFFIIYF